MGKRRCLVLMIWVGVVLWAGLCWAWGGDAVVDEARERVNLVAGNAKLKAEEAMHTAQSWGNWASDKFSQGFGQIKRENERKTFEEVMDKAGDAASRATETMNTAASDTSKYASDKAGEAADVVYQKADQTIKMTTDEAYDAKETASEAIDFGLDRAANVYDQVKKRIKLAVNEANDLDKAYNNPKETIDHQEKETSHVHGENSKGKKNVASDKIQEGTKYEKDKAELKYNNESYQKLQESCRLAKERMTKEAKTYL